MPSIILEARYKLDTLPILRKTELPYTLPIFLGDNFNPSLKLYDVYELASTKRSVEHFENIFVQQVGRPWIDVDSCKLNTLTGYHKYQLCFVNIHTDETVIFYFGYQIQDDNPNKPYMYMEEYRKESDM